MKSILTILLILSSIIQYAPQAIAENKKPATTQKPVQKPSRKPVSPKTPSRKPVFVPPKPPKGLTSIPGDVEREWVVEIIVLLFPYD